ncbi:MAG: hypothetical protein ACRDPR_20750, partial [Nocardioidaceae bacterium]
ASLVGLELARDNGWNAPEARRKAVAGAGSGEGQDALFDTTKEAAAAQSDTRRAESETTVEQSPADVEGGAGTDAGADGKGGPT